MHRRFGVLLLVLITLAAGTGGGARAQDSGAPERFVIVRTAAQRQHSNFENGIAPSLDEQGYRIVPVPNGLSEDEYLNQLRNDPTVAEAYPDAPVHAAILPNDSFYSTLQSSYLEPLNAPAAWDQSTGSQSIVVAVLDTGIDTNHPDLQGRIWVNQQEIPNDGLDNDNNGCIDDVNGCRFINVDGDRATNCGYTSGPNRGLIRDDHGKPKGNQSSSHGTLVSGIIGAAGGNGIGVTGIAWDVKIMPIKVLDCGTPKNAGLPNGDMSNVAQGIDYARRMGAHLINVSLVSEPGNLAADQPQLRAAIQAAQDAGILIVAASGNGGGPVLGYPAAYTQYPAVVGVSAANNQNGMTWETYSAYGPGVDIAAPGREIVSTSRTDIEDPNIYARATGTSFSSAMVTGTLALMIARNNRLGISEYLNAVTNSATPVPPAPHGQNWAGAGLLNIGGAVNRLPMTITGSPLHDWKDVAPGTDIRATIGSTECGATTAASFGAVSRYSLRVASDAEIQGCGLKGRTVTVSIAGRPATTTFPWPEGGQSLGLVNRDISSVTPAPGGLVVQPLGNGWSFVAHLEPASSVPAALEDAGADWTQVNVWDNDEHRYLQYSRNAPAYVNDSLTLRRYDTFWLRAPGGNVAAINPDPPSRTIQLEAGWNGFVYTGQTREVSDALEGIKGKYTAVLQYDNTTGDWQTWLPQQPRYLNDFGGLLEMHLYWIEMTEPGELVME